jgi:hypothetical protein
LVKQGSIRAKEVVLKEGKKHIPFGFLKIAKKGNKKLMLIFLITKSRKNVMQTREKIF